MSNVSQNETKSKYISEIIKEDYKAWKNEFVVFDAATSSGKTYFILNVLAKHAMVRNKKILYLCNRKKLYKDICKRVKRSPYSRNIDVMLYQVLQQKIIKNSPPVGYDYITADEIHYLTSDSFNEYTDLTYKYLMTQKNNVVIFMSATAKVFFKTLLERKKVKQSRYFFIEKDYSYVDRVFFYKAKALPTLIDSIINEYPQDKILVFCNSERGLLKLADRYKDKASYYCSESNKNPKLKEVCDPECIKEYSDDYITFDKQILITTKVLDNGIDLKDRAIRHIFTELFDIDSMIQSVGRKRALDSTDTCNFYIKNYTQQGIVCFENKVKYQIEPIQLLKKDEPEFNRKYGKDRKKLKNNRILFMNFGLKGNANNDIRTNGDIRINKMMHTKYLMDYDQIKRMLELGYAPVICGWLGEQLSSKVEILDVAPVDINLFLNYLESIVGKYLFKAEQDELKKEFIKIGLKDRTMGINTLNGKLKDIKYPFEIISETDKKRIIDGKSNPNRDKRYWMLKAKK